MTSAEWEAAFEVSSPERACRMLCAAIRQAHEELSADEGDDTADVGELAASPGEHPAMTPQAEVLLTRAATILQDHGVSFGASQP